MTRGSSINFKKSSAGFEHNDRTEEREPKHLLPEEFRQENECDHSAIEANLLLAEMIENAKKEYLARTGQKCQAKILSVEAVIYLEQHHTLDDVQKINEYLETKHGFRAVQSSIHRDEGHINDEGKAEYNYHAHVVYCNLDKEGRTILKGLEKADLRNLQSFVAEALEMTRGQSAEITNAKHKSPQEFRYEKVLEMSQKVEKIPKNLVEVYSKLKGVKRFEVYGQMRAIVGKSDGLEVGDLKFKLELSQKENKTLREELQALKDEKARERVELQGNNALRADYARMEAKYKAMEAEIRERAKPPEEIIEAIYQENDKALIDIFSQIAETVEVRKGIISKETTQVVKVDKFNNALPQMREMNRKMFKKLAENTPKAVDTKEIERLQKELVEERVKNLDLWVELKQLKEKTREVWGNIKERFKFEGSRLQDNIENLLDFSKKDPKELDHQKSRGLER